MILLARFPSLFVVQFIPFRNMKSSIFLFCCCFEFILSAIWIWDFHFLYFNILNFQKICRFVKADSFWRVYCRTHVGLVSASYCFTAVSSTEYTIIENRISKIVRRQIGLVGNVFTKWIVTWRLVWVMASSSRLKLTKFKVL